MTKPKEIEQCNEGAEYARRWGYVKTHYIFALHARDTLPSVFNDAL
jgi:hypothetical protein